MKNKLLSLCLACSMLVGGVYNDGLVLSYANETNVVEEVSNSPETEKVEETQVAEATAGVTETEEVKEETKEETVAENSETTEVSVTATAVPTVTLAPNVEGLLKAVPTEAEKVELEKVNATPTVEVTEKVEPTKRVEPTVDTEKKEGSTTDVKATTKPTETVKATETPTPTEEGTEVISADSLDEFAENLEDIMFDSKQLIILSNVADFETYGAVEVQNYENIYVLSYESSSATKSAYSKIKADKVVTSVEINEVLKVNTEGTSTKETKTTTEKTELGKYLDGLKASKSVKVAVLDTGLDVSKFSGTYEDSGIDYTGSGETSL